MTIELSWTLISTSEPASILSDLGRLQKGAALKVPLSDLTETKERVRSALNRATRKTARRVATASDGTFLYVWNETADPVGIVTRRRVS